jgi:hypothetical protein
VASGTSITIPQGSTCTIRTNAASSGTWYASCGVSQPTIAAAVGSSALTLTLYATAISFRDPFLGAGDQLAGLPAGGLSITIPSGATLGTINSTPFRVWLMAIYNSGTPTLGVILCSLSTGTIYACTSYENIQVNGTAITSGATSPGTLYTAGSITNSSARIVGYAEYGSGLSTAGTWASTPTVLQVCLPPMTCKRPGDILQVATSTIATDGSTTSSSYAALTGGQTQAFALISAANLVRFSAHGTCAATSSAAAFLQVARNTTQIGNPIECGSPAVTIGVPAGFLVWDFPGTTSSVTYGFYGKTSTGTLHYPLSTTTGSFLEIWEIMGANDNSDLRMVG